MQSDDRKLLEDAAGAFGVPAREEGGYMYAAPGEVSKTGWGIVTWMGYGTVQFWNPLESNDDAFRLAVKLGLVIDAGAHKASDGSANWFGQVGERDPYAATRRAIVRAAASLATPGSQT